MKPPRLHAPRDSEEVRSGKLLPWRSAAEVLDFSLLCPSIFETKQEIKEKYGLRVLRPLKPNTVRHIARGLDKFVIKSAEPYIIECNHDTDRVHVVKNPLNTVTAKYSAGVVDPVCTPYIM